MTSGLITDKKLSRREFVETETEEAEEILGTAAAEAVVLGRRASTCWRSLLTPTR